MGRAYFIFGRAFDLVLSLVPRPYPRGEGLVTSSLVPRHQIFHARPAALSKNRVWTPSLVKLGRNYTSVVSCRTNQIAQVK